MHFGISQEPLYKEIYRENAGAQSEPRTRTHILWSLRRRNALGHVLRATLYGNWQGKCQGPEWAQNADMHFASLRSRNELGHFTRTPWYRNLCGKCRGPEWAQNPFCASLRRRNALGHVTRATLDGNLQGKCQGPEWAQNADMHFVRACAVEMSLDISQEPLDTEIYGENAGAQGEPRTWTHILCEPAQAKCTWTCHKSHFRRKFGGKMPGPRVSPERGHAFCASLRSWNELGHFTRTPWYRNLWGKCRGPEWAQNVDTHFVRACAGEMHLDMSQEPL